MKYRSAKWDGVATIEGGLKGRKLAGEARASWVLRLITLLLVAFLVTLSIWGMSPPRVESSDTPLSEFSAVRAFSHLKTISQDPHPVGSEEHKKVREYILGVFDALGMKAAVQETTAVDDDTASPMRAATIRNITARLEGTDNTRAIMLAAHYDSAPNSPGASDDGAGVATLLETARALKSGARLKNDVLFLLTDAEEVGLLGAKAFTKENPLSKDIGVVLNFEARGASGPVFMFETSPNNGWLIRRLLRTAPRPIASSYMYEIYKKMPNDTDFSVFKKADIDGLNFAYVSGGVAYHSALDSLENIDLGSLQHHGSYAISLVRAAGNISLRDIRERDETYFDVLHTVLVSYPNRRIPPLVFLVSALFICVVALGVRRGRLKLGKTAFGSAAVLLNGLASAGMAALTVFAVQKLQSWKEYFLLLDFPSATLYMTAILSFAVAISLMTYYLLLRKADVFNLMVGATIWWVFSTIVSAVYVPGASYLFIFTLLFNLIGLMAVAARRNSDFSFNLSLLVLLCSAPGILLFAPVLYGMFKGLGLQSAPLIVAVATLLIGSLVYHLSLLFGRRGWLTPATALFAGLSLLIGGKIHGAYSSDLRKPDSIFYSKNADDNSAVWGSFDPSPDDWTSQFYKGATEKRKLAEFFPYTNKSFLVGSAPSIDVAPPNLQVLSDTAANSVRTLRMRVVSPRRAPIMLIAVSGESEVLSASVNGKPLGGPRIHQMRGGFGLRYYALPEVGVELTLETKAGPISIRLIDQSYGLPKNEQIRFVGRPDHMMPSPVVPFDHDATIVSRSFNF